MTNKVLGGGIIDGALGVNPDFSEIEAGLGRVVQSIDENGTVFYWLVESTSKGGWLLANGLYANPTKVVGDSLPIIAGSFVDGFTLTKPNQVGIDSSGDEWKYIGDDSLPVVVTPNTNPSASVDFKRLGKPSNDDYLNLKIFQSPTDGGLTEIQTRTIEAGDVYEVRKTSDDSLATIYSNAAGTIEIVQDGTSNVSGSDGVVEFYIADGDYYIEVDSVKSNFSVVKVNVVAVDSVADLLALPSRQRREGLRYLVASYYGGWAVEVPYLGPKGGGEFTWSQAATDSGDGFSVINPYATEDDGRFIRIIKVDITPEMAGAIGDGVTDDGPALRVVSDYLNREGDGVMSLRPNAIYSAWVADVGTKRPSVMRHIKNIHLRMNGAVIQTNSTVLTFNYNIIDYTSSKSCSIRGGTLRGNKYTSGATFGEWGMGIGLYGASSIDIDDMKIIEQGGDGIYIGRQGSDQLFCENITVSNTVCDDNRRQGISLISGKNLYFRNIICSNTSGTSPQDGIDIEPNNPDELLQNIIFDNVETFNNVGSGVKFFLANLDSTSESISVSFINYKSSNESQLRFRLGGNGVSGSINFSGTTELINNGVRYDDFENIDVTIDDLIINNPEGGGRSGFPIFIGMGNDTSQAGSEKLTIKRLRCYGEYERGIYISGSNQPFVRDIDIHVSHIDDAQTNNAEISISSNNLSGINITADVKDFSKNAGNSYIYSIFRHSPNFMLQAGPSTPFNLSGLLSGTTTTIINDKPFGNADSMSSVSCGVGNYFTPGTDRYGDSGSSLLDLYSRGSWVTVERMTDNTSEFRIVDGNGYAVRAT